jgi:hypothetical protein
MRVRRGRDFCFFSSIGKEERKFFCSLWIQREPESFRRAELACTLNDMQPVCLRVPNGRCPCAWPEMPRLKEAGEIFGPFDRLQ